MNCLVLLAICLTAYIACIADAADKSGECPPFHLKCPVHVGGCTSDKACSGNKKCCQIDCTVMKCTDPVYGNLQCPKFDPRLVRCMPPPPDGCQTDTDCGVFEKCCRSCRGLQCYKPAKPGKCRPSPSGVITTCQIGCQSDFLCNSTQKCCPYGCTNTCQEPDVCVLPPDSGPCEAAIPRWYYDPKSGLCKKFIYGGCKGNGNNFKTPLACKKACKYST